jgi:cytochrome c-type biogenesis protein CcmH/NrfF
MPEALLIPVAHVGHYLWILYVLPVLIVVASIVRTTLAERRRSREREEDERI